MIFGSSPQRLMVGVPGALLRAVIVDGDGEPSSPTGTLTVSVVDDRGITVACAAPTMGALGAASAAIVAARTEVGTLTATWSLDGVARVTSCHLIVGGRILTRAALRAERGLNNRPAFPDALVDRIRDAAEHLAEVETGVSWVPRHSTLTLQGSGCVAVQGPSITGTSTRVAIVSFRQVCSVRSITVDGVALAASEIIATPDRIELTRTVGHNSVIVVSAEHGYRSPPADLQSELIRYAADQLMSETNNIGPRATSYEGIGHVSLLSASSGPTDIASMNACLARYDHRLVGIG